VSLSEEPTNPNPTTGQDSIAVSDNTESASSMQDFYQLYQEMLMITLALMGIIFISVWIFYSLNIALNYLLGACGGIVYLRMLAKDVERLGRERQKLSKTRLALLVGLILLASRWNQLQIMPVFLGFLTYKATLLIYVIRVAFVSDSSR
jgi:ATP synthase protein I